MSAAKTTAGKGKAKTDEVATSSCKFRVYVNEQQHSLLSHYLYWVQKFRNEAVVFCEQRRTTRGVWLHKHAKLIAGWKALDMEGEPQDADPKKMSSTWLDKWLPDNIAGSDVNAASKWLTTRLEQAREQVAREWNITAPKQHLRAHVYNTWVNLTQAERNEIPDAWLLTVPRTVLDQCLQDMGKTYSKAIKDRAYNKANPGTFKKPAGFPQLKKHSYPSSVRFQIATTHNKTYVADWNDAYANKKKQIYIPSLGTVAFRDTQDLPAIPPELITLSRNAAGQFHVSFANKDPANATNAKLRNVNAHALPCEQLYDPVLQTHTTVPVTRGGDVGLKTLITYSQPLAQHNEREAKKEVARINFLKRQEKRQRLADKSVSRKKHGSKRWLKAKIKQGKIHTQVANQRRDYLRKEAKILVESTAIVCLEDLLLRFMLQNKHLSKAASDASLGAFKQYIQWEAIKVGHLVIECGRFDATSKTCHNCSYYYKDLTLEERTWTCPGCTTVLDRDDNAAINIRHMALLRVVSGLKDGSIVLNTSQGKAAGLQRQGIGVPKMLSPYPLHKDLTAFIERGGLTSLLALDCTRESQTDEAFISPKQPACVCKERT